MLKEIKELSDLELGYEIRKLVSDDIELVHPADGDRFLMPKKYRHQLVTFKEADGSEPLDSGSIDYNYSTDLNKISVVEKIVVERAGHLLFSNILRQILSEDKPAALTLMSHIATMPPRIRAEACLLTLKTHALKQTGGSNKKT